MSAKQERFDLSRRYARCLRLTAGHRGAVRAGLELVQAVGGLKSSAPLQIRAGIATGLVVVRDLIGSGAAQEQAVVGETPNIAARLQGVAEPNTVVIAESTRKLLGNLFDRTRSDDGTAFSDLGSPTFFSSKDDAWRPGQADRGYVSWNDLRSRIDRVPSRHRQSRVRSGNITRPAEAMAIGQQDRRCVPGAIPSSSGAASISRSTSASVRYSLGR